MQRVSEDGFREVRAPKAVVYWSIQPNLWRTFKRFVVYARNNIRAGLWRQWQAAIFQRYAVLAILCLPAFFLGLRWLLVPLACWLLLLIARAVNAIRKHRFASPASAGRNVGRISVIVPIIAVLDLAAFIGSINWLVADKLRFTGARSIDVSQSQTRSVHFVQRNARSARTEPGHSLSESAKPARCRFHAAQF